MTIEEKEIIEQIMKLSSEELQELNNLYCDFFLKGFGKIYENDQYFFKEFFENDPFGAARAKSFGNYHYDDFVIFDDCGNLKTFNTVTIKNLPDTLKKMAFNISEPYN